MYSVILSKTARNQIKKLSRRYQVSAIESLKDLSENPLTGKALVRELTGRFSIQFGPYRIIYKINKKENRIEVLTISHRRHAYT